MKRLSFEVATGSTRDDGEFTTPGGYLLPYSVANISPIRRWFYMEADDHQARTRYFHHHSADDQTTG